jgi:hypothetical protein
MSRTHYLACQTCQKMVSLGELINERPDFSRPEEALLWAWESAVVAAFLAAHVSYGPDRQHDLLVMDDDCLVYGPMDVTPRETLA